jgi:hypothetical protein
MLDNGDDCGIQLMIDHVLHVDFEPLGGHVTGCAVLGI